MSETYFCPTCHTILDKVEHTRLGNFWRCVKCNLPYIDSLIQEHKKLFTVPSPREPLQ